MAIRQLVATPLLWPVHRPCCRVRAPPYSHHDCAARCLPADRRASEPPSLRRAMHVYAMLCLTSVYWDAGSPLKVTVGAVAACRRWHSTTHHSRACVSAPGRFGARMAELHTAVCHSTRACGTWSPLAPPCGWRPPPRKAVTASINHQAALLWLQLARTYLHQARPPRLAPPTLDFSTSWPSVTVRPPG